MGVEKRRLITRSLSNFLKRSLVVASHTNPTFFYHHGIPFVYLPLNTPIFM